MISIFKLREIEEVVHIQSKRHLCSETSYTNEQTKGSEQHGKIQKQRPIKDNFLEQNTINIAAQRNYLCEL